MNRTLIIIYVLVNVMHLTLNGVLLDGNSLFDISCSFVGYSLFYRLLMDILSEQNVFALIQNASVWGISLIEVNLISRIVDQVLLPYNEED